MLPVQKTEGGYRNANIMSKEKHFDWTQVESLRKLILEKKKEQVAVVSLFRDPVARAASHFNFIKVPMEANRKPWAAELLKDRAGYLNFKFCKKMIFEILTRVGQKKGWSLDFL